jgi:hypothetical protein
LRPRTPAISEHTLRPPRVRPPDRRGGRPKTPTQIREESSTPGVSLASPSPQAYPYVHGRRSRVSDLWGTTSRHRCAHHRALPNGRHLAGDPRGLWRAQRGCDGLNVPVARRCFAAADPSDQQAQCRSRASGASRLKFLGWVQRVRSTDDASRVAVSRSIPSDHSRGSVAPCASSGSSRHFPGSERA